MADDMAQLANTIKDGLQEAIDLLCKYSTPICRIKDQICRQDTKYGCQKERLVINVEGCPILQVGNLRSTCVQLSLEMGQLIKNCCLGL